MTKPDFIKVDPNVYREITVAHWDLGRLSTYQAVAILYNIGLRGKALDLKAKYVR